jgi:hypothetical protein
LVERRNYLGIHLNTDKATVVCLGAKGRQKEVLGCFSVVLEDKHKQNLHALAKLIAQKCTDKNLQFSEVAVALDCSLFMQHNVHSEFTDAQKVAATVKFDAEEAFAADMGDSAMAFLITSHDQAGSKLSVFTAKKDKLSDIIGSLQENSMDPVSIEPDVHCLTRFASQNLLSESAEGSVFLAMLSRDHGYFVAYSKSQKAPIMRTFLVGTNQNRADLLGREALLTTALTADNQPVGRIFVFDSTGLTDCLQLERKVGVKVEQINLIERTSLSPETLSDCVGLVDFAIAYGAALANLEKTTSINFRNDFMPYQGKKLRLQKTLKFVSISVAILLFAVGLYFQTQLWKVNKTRNRLQNQLSRDYSTVMLGQKLPDKTGPVRKLGNELRRVQDIKSGLISGAGEKSISSKLTLVLEAFNNCAERTGLNIDSITVTPKTVNIEGDTSSRQSTLQLFEAMKKKFDVLPRHLESKAGRDSFSITVELQG